MSGMSGHDAGLALRGAMMRATGVCAHADIVPVTLIVTGELVANLCRECLDELPIGWGCTDCSWVETRRLCETVPTRVLATPCPAHAG